MSVCMTTSSCVYVWQAESVEVKHVWVTDIRRLLQKLSDVENGLYFNSDNDNDNGEVRMWC